MKRTIITTTVLATALFGVGCGTNQTASNSTNTSTSTSATNTTTNRASSTATTNTSSTTAVPQTTTATTEEYTIVAEQFEYSPSTITVQTGDTVILHLSSSDVTHGFSLPQFGVNEVIQPGQGANVTFVADRAGTYTYSCSVTCGAGHAGMRGTLIVE